MLFTYITPQETQILSPTQPISYPYFDVQRYATVQSEVAAGASSTMISQNIQLSSIPRRMYIYVRKRNQDLFSSTESTDTYFALSNASMQFMNKNGLLASASMQQLYEQSVKNHCTMSWVQWSGSSQVSNSFSKVGSVGSILCVEFSTDIGLESLEAPGKLAQAMLQVTVTAANTSSAAITPELYVVTVLEGVFTIKALNSASTSIGVLTSKDILDCQYDHVDYRMVQEINGGDFFSGLKEGLSKLAHQAVPIARQIAPEVNKFLRETKALSSALSASPFAAAAPVVRSFGYGEGEGEGGASRRSVSFRSPHSRALRYAGEGEGEGEGEGGVQAGSRLSQRRRRAGDGVLVPEGGAHGGEGLSRADLARRILY
jgi:hypothetical protein